MAISIDIKQLNGYGQLTAGSHNISIKAKAEHYYGDSAMSNTVSITKPSYTVTADLRGGTFQVTYGNLTQAWITVDGTYNNVVSIDDVSFTYENSQDYYVGAVQKPTLPYILTSNATVIVVSEAQE